MSTNVEQVKEKLDIVDVISAYIKVEKSGINYKAKCPFHNEKTPSFFISSTRQSFYCFGCGAKGDIFSFVEQMEGLDFKDALQNLADKAGIKLASFKNEDIRGEDEKEKLFEVMEEATGMYQKNLKENKMATDYLIGRGILEKSITKWRLGFAEDEWRNLFDYLTSKKFTKKNMLEAGLIKKVEKEEKYYDTFRDRVMFPIFDSSNRVIAFSGRSLKSDEKTPKYLNSPETKLFYKSEVLYGFNIAKNYIRKLDYTVLVEGQMDLVMSHQAGVTNTVASSGTALSLFHLQKLQKLSNRVIIAYDSDSAGEKAARRAAEIAVSLGMETKIAFLKEGEDPASVIKDDPKEWTKALRESAHFIDFIITRAFEQYEGRKLTKEVLENVLPLISLIKSDIEKSQFVKKIAQKMRVTEDIVWSDIKKINTNIDKNLEKIGNNNNIKDQKEALMFEMEKIGVKIDQEEVDKDNKRRSELQELKTTLQKIAILLDDPSISKKEEAEGKKEFIKIQKKLQDLNIKIQ